MTAMAVAEPVTEEPDAQDKAVKAEEEEEATTGTMDAEVEARRAREDVVLERGRLVGGVRALLARAYTAPAREPSRAGGCHWDTVLAEARWLATDMAQERLWKATAALAVAAELVSKRGDFGLRPPPEDCRDIHDEISRLRVESETARQQQGEKKGPTKRRGKGDDGVLAGAHVTHSNTAAPLQLVDYESDPVWADLGMLDDLALSPGTPPRVEAHAAFSYACDMDFSEAIDSTLNASVLERDIENEMTLRSYRFELESALDAHFTALSEANRRAMRLDADLAGGEVSDGALGDETDGLDLGLGLGIAKRVTAAGKRGGSAQQQRAARRTGYLLDDFAELPDAAVEFAERAPAQRRGSTGGAAAATSRQYIEDTYLRKRRRERYRETDVDYDVGAENAAAAGASRYGTRRATGAMAARAGARGASAAEAAAKRLRTAGRSDAGFRGGAVRGAAAIAWTKAEDELLLAAVHEFGLNWTLVSEVLSLSLGLQGVHRPPALCRQRFRALTAASEGDYSEERALAALGQRLSKAQARELLVAALPARDDALRRALETLVQVGTAAKQRRLAEEKRGDAARTRRQDPHASHAGVVGHVLGQTGGRRLSPLELSAAVNNAYFNQAKQQAAIAEQAQVVATAATLQPPSVTMAQQQQQQPGVNAMPAQQQQVPPLLPRPPSVGPASTSAPTVSQAIAPQAGSQASSQQQQQQQALSSAAVSPAPGPNIGATAVSPAPGVGTPGLPTVAGGMLSGMPGASTAPMLAPGSGAAGTIGTTPTTAAAGFPGAMAPPSTGSVVPPGVAQPPQLPKPAQPPQITLQQLNHILATNNLPNGQPLSPEMREAIQKKRDAYLAQMQAAQLRQQQQIAQQMQMQAQAAAAAAAAAARGQPPPPGGVPSSASPMPPVGLGGYPAAAAAPGGGTPGTGPGTMPPPLGMAPGALLPPGMQLGHAGMTMPHGTATLAAAQQQMLAQQLLAHQHQQQQAAAAAAAAAAGQQQSSQQSHPASQTTTAG